MDSIRPFVAPVLSFRDLSKMVGERRPAKIADEKVGGKFAATGAELTGRRFWLFYFAAWIPYLYVYASTLLITGEASFWPAILVALGSAMPAALLGITVVWFTGKLKTPSPRWPVFLAAHGRSRPVLVGA